ncbi:MAG TPA: hypothetical protein VJ843_00645 [Candidatus Saccharimonadales bacterium]|nr:hypothetical protein [Candidatus Saccharimonadales bacterium]
MTDATTTFFAKFSLRALVGSKLSLTTLGPRGVFPGGGVGAAYGGSEGRNYQKSEGYSHPIHTAGDDRFNESVLITALRAELKAEITNSGAAITFEGDIEGNFNSSEFYFEYAQGSIRGRIIISGKVIGDSYSLRAALEERT